MNFKMHATINAPVPEVFRFTVNLEDAPRWHATTVQTVKLTGGPIGLGTRWRKDAAFLGMRFSFDLEVIAWEPERFVELRSNLGGPIVPHFAMRFAEVGEDTRMEFIVQPEIHPLLLPLMWPFIVLAGRRDLARYFEKVKAALE